MRFSVRLRPTLDNRLSCCCSNYYWNWMMTMSGSWLVASRVPRRRTRRMWRGLTDRCCWQCCLMSR